MDGEWVSHDVTNSDSFNPAPTLHSDPNPGPEGGTGDSSWLSPILLAITRVILKFPVTTLAVAAGVAGICVAYTAGHLGYKSSRLDLLNPKSEYNRLWIEYINEFGDEDDAVLVVEGPGRDEIVPVLGRAIGGAGAGKAAVSRDFARS